MKISVGKLRSIIQETYAKIYQKRTFDQFRKQWEGKPVFLRFENNSPGIPVTLNRDSTYGDIWGIWSFYLEYDWPKQRYLTSMSDAYVFEVKTQHILNTSDYTYDDLKSNIEKLRTIYGDKVDNAFSREEKRKSDWAENVGEEYAGPFIKDMTPFQQLYNIVQDIEGTTRSTNFILRKLGYDVIIDGNADVSEGVYAPAVSAVVLNPTVVNVIDSFHRFQ